MKKEQITKVVKENYSNIFEGGEYLAIEFETSKITFFFEVLGENHVEIIDIQLKPFLVKSRDFVLGKIDFFDIAKKDFECLIELIKKETKGTTMSKEDIEELKKEFFHNLVDEVVGKNLRIDDIFTELNKFFSEHIVWIDDYSFEELKKEFFIYLADEVQ